MSLTTGSCPGSQVALTSPKVLCNCSPVSCHPTGTLESRPLCPLEFRVYYQQSLPSSISPRCSNRDLAFSLDTAFPLAPLLWGPPATHSCGNPHISGSADGVDVLFFTATSRSFHFFPKNPSFQISQPEIVYHPPSLSVLSSMSTPTHSSLFLS